MRRPLLMHSRRLQSLDTTLTRYSSVFSKWRNFLNKCVHHCTEKWRHLTRAARQSSPSHGKWARHAECYSLTPEDQVFVQTLDTHARESPVCPPVNLMSKKRDVWSCRPPESTSNWTLDYPYHELNQLVGSNFEECCIIERMCPFFQLLLNCEYYGDVFSICLSMFSFCMHVVN